MQQKSNKRIEDRFAQVHIERQYTLIYTIVGEKPDRHAKINEILTYEKAHQIYGLL